MSYVPTCVGTSHASFDRFHLTNLAEYTFFYYSAIFRLAEPLRQHYQLGVVCYILSDEQHVILHRLRPAHVRDVLQSCPPRAELSHPLRGTPPRQFSMEAMRKTGPVFCESQRRQVLQVGRGYQHSVETCGRLLKLVSEIETRECSLCKRGREAKEQRNADALREEEPPPEGGSEGGGPDAEGGGNDGEGSEESESGSRGSSEFSDETNRRYEESNGGKPRFRFFTPLQPAARDDSTGVRLDGYG